MNDAAEGSGTLTTAADPPSLALAWLLVIAGGVAREVLLHHSLHYFVDDSYIFLRYARNLQTGHGLVYNAGQRVMGFTSPLYVLLLGATAVAMGSAHLVGATEVIDLVLYLLASVVIVRLTRRGDTGGWIFLAAWVLYFPVMAAAVNGMETMLFVFLFYLALLLALEARFGAALGAAALGGLTRPEGLILLGLVVAGVLLLARPIRSVWLGAVLACAALIGWVAFALGYYGTVVPQSILAKSALTGTSGGPLQKLAVVAVGLSTSQYGQLGRTAGLLLEGVGVLVGVLAVGSLVAEIGRRSIAAVVPAWFLATWVFYVVGHPIQLWSWYSAPTTLAVWWMVSRHVPGLVAHVVSSIATVQQHRLRRVAPAAVAAITVVVALGSIAVGVGKRQASLASSVVGLRRLATDIERSSPHARTVILDDIGIVGWVGRDWTIIDSSGLVSPLGAERAHGRLLSVYTLAARSDADVICLKANPASGARFADPILDRPISEDAAQRAQLLREYRIVPVDTGSYLVILVRRT